MKPRNIVQGWNRGLITKQPLCYYPCEVYNKPKSPNDIHNNKYKNKYTHKLNNDFIIALANLKRIMVVMPTRNKQTSIRSIKRIPFIGQM